MPHQIGSIIWMLLGAMVAAEFAILPNGTFTNTTDLDISANCVSAAQATVACDPYLNILSSGNLIVNMNNTILDALCTASCGSSLASYHHKVIDACKSDPEPWQGIPVQFYGDVVWSTYNQTCLKDPKSGEYCSGQDSVGTQ